MSAVRLQQKHIVGLVEEVKALHFQNAEKEKRITHLENRVADLEQYTRMNDVIVTGLQVKPRSYARVVNNNSGGEHDELDMRSREEQVAAFLESKGIHLDTDNMEACHPLSRRSATDKPAVILRFINRKHKMTPLKQGKKLKGANVFMNDHLTKNKAEIARRAQYVKKLRKIANTWTVDIQL